VENHENLRIAGVRTEIRTEDIEITSLERYNTLVLGDILKDPTGFTVSHTRRYSRPGLVMWELWWTKWRWSRFSPSTSVSPANFNSTNCSKNHPHLSSGLYNRPKWPQYQGLIDT
jgi:hypothetical protein